MYLNFYLTPIKETISMIGPTLLAMSFILGSLFLTTSLPNLVQRLLFKLFKKRILEEEQNTNRRYTKTECKIQDIVGKVEIYSKITVAIMWTSLLFWYLNQLI